MSASWTRPASFVIGFVVLTLVLQRLYNTGDNLTGIRAAQYAKFAASTKLLVIGDSRAEAGFDPTAIDSSFNYGRVGSNYVQLERHLGDLLSVNHKIRTIVLTLAPNILYTAPLRAEQLVTEDSLALHRIFGADVDWDFNDGTSGAVAVGPENPVEQKLKELYPYAGNLRALWAKLRKARLDSVYRGFVHRQGATHRWGQDGKGRATRIFANVSGPNPQSMASLLRIIQTADAHNIRMVLVRWPVMRNYADAVEKFVPEALYQNLVASLLTEYPQVTYIDLRDEFADRADLYADVDHLNQEGAKLFTEVIGVRLRSKPDSLYNQTPALSTNDLTDGPI